MNAPARAPIPRTRALWSTKQPRGLDNGGMNILRTVARPLLAAPFIHDGISALLNPADHVARASFVLPIAERIAPGAGLEEEDLRLMTRVLGAASIAAGVAFAVTRKR